MHQSFVWWWKYVNSFCSFYCHQMSTIILFYITLFHLRMITTISGTNINTFIKKKNCFIFLIIWCWRWKSLIGFEWQNKLRCIRIKWCIVLYFFPEWSLMKKKFFLFFDTFCTQQNTELHKMISRQLLFLPNTKT